jgi:hypothetical protein
MGTTQSNNNIDFNSKLYIVIDLYLKPKFEPKQNFNIDNLKTNVFLKKNLKDIIVNSLFDKYNRNVILYENNILLISKTDKDNIKYLEMNATVEFSEPIEKKAKLDIIPTSTPTFIYSSEILYNNFTNISIETLKMNILSELYNYVTNQYGIITSDITIIILQQTLNNIELYQK